MSPAHETQMGHSQGIKGGVAVGKLMGSGRSSPLTCHRSPGPTQAARPNRNASCSICLSHSTQKREKGRKEAHPSPCHPKCSVPRVLSLSYPKITSQRSLSLILLIFSVLV